MNIVRELEEINRVTARYNIKDYSDLVIRCRELEDLVNIVRYVTRYNGFNEIIKNDYAYKCIERYYKENGDNTCGRLYLEDGYLNWDYHSYEYYNPINVPIIEYKEFLHLL